jgi:NAD(P)-dependent dehydrogenase (short-subunit alcohol dehydrogenase family)
MSEKRVLITGPSGLIGRALVERFQSANWKVIAPTRADFDLAILGNGAKMIEAAGAIDILINNAADQSVLDPKQVDSNLISTLFQINTFAILESMVAAKAKGASIVINLSSIEALTPRSGHEIYGASKAALEALTKSMAIELAPMRINAVRLGLVGGDDLQARWPEGVSSWRNAVPTKRYASPTEVAEFIFTICGKEFDYSTGAIFDFDGGKSASPGW